VDLASRSGRSCGSFAMGAEIVACRRRLDLARDLTMDSRDGERRAPLRELPPSLCTVRPDTVEARSEHHWRTAAGQAAQRCAVDHTCHRA
jgi:hypothetical protein